MSATLAPENGTANGKGGGTSSALLNHLQSPAHLSELRKLEAEQRKLVERIQTNALEMARIRTHLMIAGIDPDGMTEAGRDG